MRLLLPVALAALTAGCAIKPPAASPKVTAGLDPSQRAAIYGDYHLDHKNKTTWSRRDGEYEYGQVVDLFDAYPESKAKKSSAVLRAGVIGGFVGGAGGLSGFVVGYSIAAQKGHGLSGPAIGGLLGAAGGLLVTAVIIGLATDNPLDTIGDEYNRGLARQLEVDPKAIPAAPPTPPGPTGDNAPSLGVSYGVAF
jgi:hypothetical protein